MTDTHTTELGLILTQKVARVSILGFQEVPAGHPDFPGVTLYKVISAEGIAEKSTVNMASLVKQGFKVEVVS